MTFRRRIGPPPLSRIGAIWRGLVIGPAPIRLWAQVLGFGTVIGVVAYVLSQIFQVIAAGVAPLDVIIILAKGAVQIGLALVFLAIIQAVAITELKVGFSASSQGLKADLERDEDHTPAPGGAERSPPP